MSVYKNGLHVEDLRRQAEFMLKKREEREAKKNGGSPNGSKGLGANIGEMMAVMMAAAGASICNFAGARPCETDYLAVSGAKFPEQTSQEMIQEFNDITMRLPDDEASEVRYEMMSVFFHPEQFKDKMKTVKAKVRRMEKSSKVYEQNEWEEEQYAFA